MKLELDKITILPICLQTSKTSVESLEKVLINSFNQKRQFTLKKPSKFVKSRFVNHAEAF